MTTLLEYIGTSQANGTYEVPDEKVDDLLKTGTWRLPEKYPAHVKKAK